MTFDTWKIGHKRSETNFVADKMTSKKEKYTSILKISWNFFKNILLHLPSWDLTSTGNLRQPGDFSIRINNFNVSYEKDVFVRDNSFNETSK